jgi:hypothetical protein
MHVHVVDICNHVLPRWTQEQLKKVIAMLQDPAFYSKEIDPDLHKRMDKAAMCMRWQVCQLKRLVPSNAQDNMDVGSPCPELGPEDGDFLCQARCCRNRRGHQH